MAQLKANIPAPVATPPRYGLIAVAPTQDTPDGRWTAGFAFTPEQCGQGGRAAINCGGSTDVLDPDGNPTPVEGDAFVVWAGDACSTFGLDARDYQGRARRQLAAIESYELANELWTGSLRDDTNAATPDTMTNVALVDTSSDTVTNGAVSPLDALGCLEQGLGSTIRGQRGMIHVTPQMLVQLVGSGAVQWQGGVWVTPMQNLVVADAGYDGSGPNSPAGATTWAYATSMIYVRLGPVEVIPGEQAEAVDRALNDIRYLAERPVAYVWDHCAHLAAEVDLPTCFPGGWS